MKELGVGIIGCGGIARARHAPGWQDCPGASILALADIDRVQAEDLAEEYSAPRVFADYRRLLQIDEIDVVSICTPNTSHAEIAIAALQAGKHVLVEKPMAVSSAQASAMVRESRKSGRLLMAGQHFRFVNSTQALKPMVDAGELGDIYFARVQALRRRYLPPQLTYTQKKNSGGGCLYDIGVHMLDLALHLMSFPEAVSVSGITQTAMAKSKDVAGLWGEWDRKSFDVEDFAAGSIRFANGSIMSLEVSWLLNMGERQRMQADLYGSRGGIVWPSRQFFTERNGQLLNTEIEEPPETNPHHDAIRALADAIRDGNPSPIPPEESAQVVAILEAFYKSSATGKEAPLRKLKF
jgi:predicted dehydrogenase